MKTAASTCFSKAKNWGAWHGICWANTTAETTIAGLRQKVGGARIVAVLEPRSNTMKLGTMKAALPGSLQAADAVFCYAGGVDWDVQAALAPLGGKLHVGRDFDGFVDDLAAFAQSGDHVLIMSNGGFGGIHDKLLAKLAAKYSELKSQ